jgi:hypothetical protein
MKLGHCIKINSSFINYIWIVKNRTHACIRLGEMQPFNPFGSFAQDINEKLLLISRGEKSYSSIREYNYHN